MSYDFILVSIGLPAVVKGAVKVYECQLCFALVRKCEEHWNIRHRTTVDPDFRDRAPLVQPVE